MQRNVSAGIPWVAGMLMLLSGCGPSPHDAFVECRTKIERAAVLADTKSCFLQAEAAFLRNERERAEFLAELGVPPLEALTLVRTDALESQGEERVALRFDVAGRPDSHTVTGYSAVMKRLDGQWWYERQGIFVHAGYDYASQASVEGTLDFSGALELASASIVAGHHVEGSRHALVVKDRFHGAAMRFLSPRPWRHGRHELGGDIEAEAMLDHDHYFVKEVAGHLEIAGTGESGLSGSFGFRADSNHSGPIEVSGTFSGVPRIAL